MSGEKNRPGPAERRIRLEGDWKEAVKKALKKQRPKEGWPKPKTDKD